MLNFPIMEFSTILRSISFLLQFASAASVPPLTVVSFVRATCTPKPDKRCIGTFISPMFILTTRDCAQTCFSIDYNGIDTPVTKVHVQLRFGALEEMRRDSLGIVQVPVENDEYLIVSTLDPSSAIGHQAFFPRLKRNVVFLQPAIITLCNKDSVYSPGWYVCASVGVRDQCKIELGTPLLLDGKVIAVMGRREKKNCKYSSAVFIAVAPVLSWIQTIVENARRQLKVEQPLLATVINTSILTQNTEEQMQKSVKFSMNPFAIPLKTISSFRLAEDGKEYTTLPWNNEGSWNHGTFTMKKLETAFVKYNETNVRSTITTNTNSIIITKPHSKTSVSLDAKNTIKRLTTPVLKNNVTKVRRSTATKKISKKIKNPHPKTTNSFNTTNIMKKLTNKVLKNNATKVRSTTATKKISKKIHKPHPIITNSFNATNIMKKLTTKVIKNNATKVRSTTATKKISKKIIKPHSKTTDEIKRLTTPVLKNVTKVRSTTASNKVSKKIMKPHPKPTNSFNATNIMKKLPTKLLKNNATKARSTTTTKKISKKIIKPHPKTTDEMKRLTTPVLKNVTKVRSTTATKKNSKKIMKPHPKTSNSLNGTNTIKKLSTPGVIIEVKNVGKGTASTTELITIAKTHPVKSDLSSSLNANYKSNESNAIHIILRIKKTTTTPRERFTWKKPSSSERKLSSRPTRIKKYLKKKQPTLNNLKVTKNKMKKEAKKNIAISTFNKFSESEKTTLLTDKMMKVNATNETNTVPITTNEITWLTNLNDTKSITMTLRPPKLPTQSTVSRITNALDWFNINIRKKLKDNPQVLILTTARPSTLSTTEFVDLT